MISAEPNRAANAAFAAAVKPMPCLMATMKAIEGITTLTIGRIH
jgi:hypothetical protein